MLVDPHEQLLETITEIIPSIYLANNNVAKNMNFYEEKDIKAVLNCSHDLAFYKDGIHQMRLCIVDTPDSVQEFYKQLPLCVEFINTNQPILVHCFAGMSRSASVYAAYLIKHHNHTPQSAVNLIMQHRPFAFNWGQMFYYANALNKFHQDCLHERACQG